MGEKSLHGAIKNWYAHPGDRLEALVDGYLVDIVRDDMLIEIQTRNFSALKPKLTRLTESHRVRLVHPVSQRKWIIRLDASGGAVLSRRRSPKRGRVEDVFHELVYIPSLLRAQNFSLEVLLVRSEDLLIDNGKGSWRRRRWSIHDRRLLDVIERVLFEAPDDLLKLLPSSLPGKFTTKDLSRASKLRVSTAQKMAYCLRQMGLIEAVDKRGRALLYSLPV